MARIKAIEMQNIEFLVQVEMASVIQGKISKTFLVMKIYLLKIEMNTDLRMERYTKVNGEVKLDMVLVSKYGQMVLAMKDIGRIIKLMERVNFGM